MPKKGDGELTRMKMEMLSNMRVLDPTAHEKKRTLQTSSGNNDLLGLDDQLTLDRIVRVGTKVRVSRRPDTLHATGDSLAVLLVEQDSVYFVSLYELGTSLGCVRQIGLRGTLFASGMAAHRAMATVVIGTPGVLGHCLAGISQFARTFKGDAVAVVVLDVGRRTNPFTDAIQRLLELQRRKVRQAGAFPLLSHVGLRL